MVGYFYPDFESFHLVKMDLHNFFIDAKNATSSECDRWVVFGGKHTNNILYYSQSSKTLILILDKRLSPIKTTVSFSCLTFGSKLLSNQFLNAAESNHPIFVLL